MNYQLLVVLNFFSTVFIMKVISWLVTEKRIPFLVFAFTCPYPSTRSLKFKAPPDPAPYWSSALLYLCIGVLILGAAREFLVPLNYWKILIITPSVYFLTDFMGSMGQLIFSWHNRTTFPIHADPLSSGSLSQFWGRHWNLWIQDWLKDMNKLMRGKGHAAKVIFTFFVSGLFHEIMVNLPYWLKYGESYFGTMTGYFLIQALGLWIDKKFLKDSPLWLRRLYMYLVIWLPSPLFVNKPLLLFFGLTN